MASLSLASLLNIDQYELEYNNLSSIELGSLECRKLFQLETFNNNNTTTKKTLFLNHGSYGATPCLISSSYRAIQEYIESFPDRWFRIDSYSMILEAMNCIAPFLKTDSNNLVFVSNATYAMNCIFQSINLKENDICVCLNAIYPAIHNALKFKCESVNADIITVPFELPVIDFKQILNAVEDTLKLYNGRVKLAVFDHISWNTGIIMPIEELILICKKYNVLVAIDGAHCVGQIPIDLDAIKPDFYTSNFHKWMFTPRGSAFLYCDPKHQNMIVPLVVSHNWKSGYTSRFWSQGTRDESSFIAAASALKFYKSIGVDKILKYNFELASWAADYISTRFSTERICPRHLNAFLVVVRLPIRDADSDSGKSNFAQGFSSVPDVLKDSVLSRTLMAKMLTEESMISALFTFRGYIYVRISAQIYNCKDDYIKFADYIEAYVNKNSLLE